jgi:hypothetical protein
MNKLGFINNSIELQNMMLQCFALSGPLEVRGLEEGESAEPPNYGRSVNPIRVRLCPPKYYLPHRIFRPSYGPDSVTLVQCENVTMHLL